MKNGWQTKTLEEVCQFSNGLWKGEKPPFVNVGVIRNTNFTKEGTLDDSDIAYLDVELKKFEKRRLQFGDIILEKSGGGPKQPVGRVVFFDKEDGDFSFSNFTAALRVLDPHELDFRFLHKFLFWTHLSGVTEGMQSHSTGIRNLDGDAYKAIKINFPALPEQRRIVGILDEAYVGLATAKANAEKNLQNAREFLESYHDSVFGNRYADWEQKPLGDVCEYVNGKAHEGCIDDDGRFIVINSKFIASEGEVFKRSNTALLLLQPDDIAMVLSDLPNGKALAKCFLVENANTYTLNQRICLIRSKNFCAKFLFYQLNRNRHFLAFDNGENQTNLRLNQVLSCPLFLPPRSEQETIAEKLDAMAEETERLESIYQQKVAALEALKKSLLHHAFTGQLR